MDIETGRLILRRLAKRDVDAMTRIMEDPEVVEFVGGGLTSSRAEVAAWIARDGRRVRETGFGARAITLRAGGDLIGWIGTSRSEDAPGRELTFGIAARYRRRGYGAEALAALIGATPRFPTYAWAESVNEASLRMLSGCGFRVIGRSSEAGGSCKVRLALKHSNTG
ncbi:GNAT family N-acetyltransferase [Sphingosinicellaceae bacterium]|nr:GNAT family N-acetyltransferase [Sphingosinicellaceae bacterium]